MLFKHPARWPVRLILPLALAAGFSYHGRAGQNLMAEMNDTDYTAYVDDPWGCAVNGVITAQQGVQLAVDDNGNVRSTIFGPSVAVGDLNGDGLPDIVMADAKGYFWFFPNSGTPKVPKFTTGEVMPIWIGAPPEGIDDEGLIARSLSTSDNVVPRIQLVDFSGEHRLSIVAGDYEGKLFYIHNTGSSTQPNFSMPTDLTSITRRDLLRQQTLVQLSLAVPLRLYRQRALGSGHGRRHLRVEQHLPAHEQGQQRPRRFSASTRRPR